LTEGRRDLRVIQEGAQQRLQMRVAKAAYIAHSAPTRVNRRPSSLPAESPRDRIRRPALPECARLSSAAFLIAADQRLELDYIACSNSGEASAALSHIRASISPVRSFSTSARYLPPSFLSRSDFIEAVKKRSDRLIFELGQIGNKMSSSVRILYSKKTAAKKNRALHRGKLFDARRSLAGVDSSVVTSVRWRRGLRVRRGCVGIRGCAIGLFRLVLQPSLLCWLSLLGLRRVASQA